MSYASASAPPGSATNLSAHSGSGAVNGWCTEVQPPSLSSSNIGASTTQRNDHAEESIRPHRFPISSRAAPSSSRDAGAGPAAKNTQSPGTAPVASASPDRSASDRFFATGPETSPAGPISAYARPRAPRDRAHSCHPSSSRRDCAAPPGMTTAPTYGAWNTRNSVPATYSVRSASSQPNRRSGLSEPYRAIASAYVILGSGLGTSYPASSDHSRATTSSATVITSCLVTNDISMSIWVNSGCRSLRKSSSLKHLASW